MPSFNWLSFLKQRNIPYVTSGPNFSKRNAANIKCPFCGDSDPSEHMGLGQNGGWWGCLRNSAHRGRDPTFLIQKLIHCSAVEAKAIVGGDAAPPTAGDLAAVNAALKQTTGANPVVPNLELPPDFKPLLNKSPFAEPFIDYLMERGYRSAQIEWLAKEYDLRYSVKGAWAYRLILPVVTRYGELLTWTARTILPDVVPRYKTLQMQPKKSGDPVAKLAANNTVLGLPVLWGAGNPKALVLVEGPFDALKLTAFGHSLGLYATCLFGLNIYPLQVAELQELSERYERRYLMIDEDAALQRLRLLQPLAALGFKALKLTGAEDPGAMTAEQVVKLALDLTA